MQQDKLRNIAIIAHVDHGKTTLVDAMLKQTHAFATHQKEFLQTTIMDSNDLEREKGVTILAKNTAVFWRDYKINILDTPGHADFSGEVERVLNMADGCLLLIDAAEGVLSQTRFVLKLALELGLKPIVVINKIDRKDQRYKAVESEVADLFLELATRDDQLDFPILYAKGIEGIVGSQVEENEDHSLKITDSVNLEPLFDLLTKTVAAPQGNPGGQLQVQINSLDADDYIGRLAIGKVFQGQIRQGQAVMVVDNSGQKISSNRVEHLFTYQGLKRVPILEAAAGEIIAVAGMGETKIGQTINQPEHLLPLPSLTISEPTVQMLLSVNTSPMAGEADYCTSRQLQTRLKKELETNVGLRLKPGFSGESMTIIGRGELHLAILIETMRRESYEFSLSRPEVVLKQTDQGTLEPWEKVMIEVPSDYTGAITAGMAKRKAVFKNMVHFQNLVRFDYEIATANLIGFRSELLTQTSGSGILHSAFLDYLPQGQKADWNRGGAIISQDTGTVTAYALEKAQQRGTMIVNPGEKVYNGQVVGIHKKPQDMQMNVTKGKKLTNMRAASADATVVLAPAWKPSLEQFLTLIAEDELLEVTPTALRLRKKKLAN